MPTVRTTKQKTSAKDFFLYLASAVTLYVSAVSLLNLLFDVINARFPDALDYGFDPYSSSLRLAIATLVIVFPIYIVLMRFLNTEIAAVPARRDAPIRKWLTYATLFLASIAIIVDLVVLINTFLGGEVTVRFIWKVLSVLVVSSGVFGYYFYDLRSFWHENRRQAKLVSVVSSLFVIGALVCAFTVVGTPATQRLVRIDNQKVSDLQSVQWQIINYWQQKERLPKSLDDLTDPISGFMVPHDPESGLGKTYTYAATAKLTFEICADFNRPTPTTGTPYTNGYGMGSVAYDTSYPSRGIDENWEHGTGVHCFKRTIDPELYPVTKK